MTNIEFIRKNYPARLSDTAIGGVMGCPEDYGLKSLRKEYRCKEDCELCWKLQVE